MTKHRPPSPGRPTRRGFESYRGLRGKVVERVEHEFEEGILYLHVRFTDRTELCWQIVSRMTIQKADLADWKSGDFEQLRTFIRNERDGSR